ncbi:hypothetical protein BsWGS_25813 [Bradybaena similaris]
MFRLRSTLCCAALVLVCVLGDVDADPLACGGQLTQEAGQIVSPNFPGQYPVNADCSWVITVQPGKIIDLKFLTLDLEDAYQRCTDYVGLYNGPSLQDAIMSGDLCLASSERQYRSRGNQMLVHFHSDSTLSRTGFSATYKTVDCPPFTYGRDECNQPCSCVQENSFYCNSVNSSCVCKPGWTSADCSVDINECSQPYVCSDLYSVCVNTPGDYNCSCLYGMQLNATGQCVDQHVCKTKKCSHVCGIENSKETCYCPKGMKLDPTDNATCRACEDWKFGENCAFDCACNKERTASCDKVEGLCSCYLNWTSTNCTQDVNECGLEKPPCNTTHSWCYNTGGSFECICYKGYEMVDDALSCQECGRTLTNASGSIVSHQYHDSGPAYWDQTFVCNWTIAIAEGNVISLQFPYLNNTSLYSCQVDIFDGDSPRANLIGSYDTRNIYPRDLIISSSSNKMHIVRRTSNYWGAFVAIYWSHKCPAFTWGPNCTSPCRCVQNNTDYCDVTNGHCVCKKAWKSADCSVDADECADDPLACPDYSDCQNLNGSYGCTCKDGLVESAIGCSLNSSRGHCVMPSTRSSNCSQACVDKKVSGQPLTPEKCYCPIGMTLEAGTCVECKDMTFGPDCGRQCQCVRNNTVKCDPQTGACQCLDTWTGPYCSQDIDECYLRIDHCLPMSDCMNTPGGRRCICREIGHEESENGTCECDHTLTNSTGNFTSPNYPQTYFQNARCSWTITVADGDVISLRVSEFGLYPYDSKCNYEYIAVYDGHNDTARLIGQYCRTVPELLRSSRNNMFIKLFTQTNGYTGFNASYTSHPCPDFMYGDVSCDKNCTCNKTNTLLCDSANGICVCKSGWVGFDCSTDLNECLDTRQGICPANSDCINTIGSFDCRCHPGFAMNKTSNTCYYAPDCKHKNCSHTCYVNSQGVDQCVCPEGLVLDQVEELFCVVPLYPHGSASKDDQIIRGANLQNNTSAQVQFGSAVPFGAALRSTVTVHLNGLISLHEGQSAIMGTPDLKLALDIHVDVIATYWANVNPSRGQVFYKLYEKCEAAMFSESAAGPSGSPNKTEVMRRVGADISSFYNLPGFEPDTALVVTWEKLSPFDTSNQGGEENTFQAVFVSGWTKENKAGQTILLDEKTSYVIFLYQKGLMTWHPVHGRPISIGTTGDNFQDLNSAGSSLATMIDTVLGNAGQNGLWTYKVGSSKGPEQKCHQYVCSHANLISDPIYQAELNQLYQCPCTLERLGRQWQLYEKRGVNQDIYCYAISALAKRRLLFGNLRNKLCCYRWKKPECGDWQAWERTWREASYVPKSPDSGHVLLNDLWSVDPFDNFQARENIQAHQWCCKDSNSADLCNRFYKVFPDMGCSNFVVFVPASALGDPHITTLDGKTYTMNGWGEYIMLDVPSENFTLQARTGRAETSSGTVTNATVFTAFAGRESDYAHFQVELAWTNTTMVIIANGADLTNDFYNDADFTFYNEHIGVSRECRINKTLVVVTFPCGVSVKINVGVKSLEVELEVNKDLGNKTKGLMGNFNGDMSDEFVLPNGTILAANLSERDVFYKFARNWQVTTANSVFNYDQGESTTNYSHPEFVPMFFDEANETQVKEAEIVCRVKDDACIYDYLVTRDDRFAQNTKEVKAQQEINTQSLDNKLPTANVTHENLISGRWVVTQGREATIQVVISDGDNDKVNLQIVGESLAGITVADNGLITYIADINIAITLKVRAVDAKGGSSPIIIIPISTCSGCHGHGHCDPNGATRKAANQTDDYQILACVCDPAYTGADCESELDGCAIQPCSVGQNCTDLTAKEQGSSPIGYKCGPCPTGFMELEGKCADINECRPSNPCGQTCVNTEGSYLCTCRDGYRLNTTDQQTCIDIDECQERIAKCHQGCNNTAGSYVCTCGHNYNLMPDGVSCELDPSVINQCQHCEQVCIIDNGNVSCGCRVGFEVDTLDVSRCKDIDECSTGNMPCSQDCVNIVGWYHCQCYPGFQLETDEVSCSACPAPSYGKNCASTCNCRGRGTCDPVRGCVCVEQWTGASCELDVDECAHQNACPAGQLCVNEQGSFSCQCPDGYLMDSGVCTDIDECSGPQAVLRCSSTEVCVNNRGSFSCDCKSGYARNSSQSQCQDIDECSRGVANCEQICENVPGLYNCKCHPGYKLTEDRRACRKDRDLCGKALNCSHGCSVDVIKQVPFCYCPLGYKLINSTTCQDIDECTNDTLNLCTFKSDCVNTNGSFICSCKDGFKLANDRRTCVACTGGTWGPNCASSCSCGIGADHCNATIGCVCKSGFTGQYCNDDINECENGQLTCQRSEQCVNLPGTAVCVCQDGYHNINGRCEDINECDNTTTNNCSQVCTNIDGGFLCSCHPGYMYDASANTCVDVNECDTPMSKCGQICTNAQGSYRCSCLSGFRLIDGVSCEKIGRDVITCNCTGGGTCISRANVCLCPKGKHLDNTSTTCLDSDLCAHTLCKHGCMETRENTSFECLCPPGEQLAADGITCTECPRGTWGTACANRCTCVAPNTEACDRVSGNCTCKVGWQGADCSVDIDECSRGMNVCSQFSTCRNTPGGFVCPCQSGYFRRSVAEKCQECDDGYYGDSCLQRCKCGRNSLCDKVNGSCYCSPGWTGTSCDVDIDECQQGTHQCSPNNHERCVNTDGGYECSCERGTWRNCTGCGCQECGQWKFGDNCSETCNCNKTNTDSCNSTDGTCSCRHGWTGADCSTDVDECHISAYKCPKHSDCKNTPGAHVCVCNVGYKMDDTQQSCQECGQWKFGDNCSETCNCNKTNTDSCNSTDGTCSCRHGWTGADCSTDVDECHTSAYKCPEHSDCMNTPGAYVCVCNVGYKMNATQQSCQECGQWKFGDNCSETCNCNKTNTNSCNSTDGTCSCRHGWTGADCSTDVDECHTSAYKCPEHSDCMNTPGAYVCVCNVGYKMDATQQSCQECGQWKFGDNCSETCNCNKTNTNSCNSTDGTCSCRHGWTGADCSTDVDECHTSAYKCPEHSDCMNTPGAYVCVCNVGYKMDATQQSCQECGQWKFGDNCSETCNCNKTNTNSCNSTDGTCSCRHGWTGADCSTDVDECHTSAYKCPEHSDCMNTPGAYVCVCNVGYKMDATQQSCQECGQWKFGDNCSETCNCNKTNTNSCNSTDGTCSCRHGWTGADCSTDVDECHTSAYKCPEHSDCMNTPGAYVCVCNVGYKMDATQQSCQECGQWAFGDNCSETCNCNKTNTNSCNSTDGTCSCRHGWTGADCSTDVDECHTSAYKCPEHSDCKNTPGAHVCVCNAGYKMDATQQSCQECGQWKFGNNCSETCNCNKTNTDSCNSMDGTCSCRHGWTGADCSTDVDKCHTSAYKCPEHSDCKNTPGAYVCVCNVGYEMNATQQSCQECGQWKFGENCSEICDCNKTNTNSCNSTDGTCSCRHGWTGADCSTDVDECHTSAYKCPEHSDCKNTPGAYVCVCNVGYEMDATQQSCQECDLWTYGHNCSSSCSCNSTNTKHCSSKDGICECQPAWTGTDCTQAVVMEVVQTVVTLEYDVSGIDLTEIGSGSYKALKADVEEQMSLKLSFEMKVTVSVTVTKLRQGSLIADTNISFPKQVAADPNKFVTKAVLSVMNNGGLQINGRAAGIMSTKVANQVFEASEDKCEQLQKYNPCDGTCQEVDDEAFCVSAKNDDSNLNVRLTIGLSVSMFVLLCIIVALVVFYCMKKPRKSQERRHKTEESEVNKNHDIGLHHIGKRFSPDTGLYYRPYDRPESEAYVTPRSVLYHDAGPATSRYSSLVGKADRRPEPDAYSHIRIPRVTK